MSLSARGCDRASPSTSILFRWKRLRLGFPPIRNNAESQPACFRRACGKRPGRHPPFDAFSLLVALAVSPKKTDLQVSTAVLSWPLGAVALHNTKFCAGSGRLVRPSSWRPKTRTPLEATRYENL